MAKKKDGDVPVKPLTPEEREKARTDPLIDKVLEAATAHGEASEPDHEVGDLQQALRTAWELLGPVEREKFIASYEVKEILEWLE